MILFFLLQQAEYAAMTTPFTNCLLASSPSGAVGTRTGSAASGTAATSSPRPSAGAADKTSAQFFGAGLAGLLAIFAL